MGRGRLLSGLDLLVPRAHLADAQARLAAAGWREVALDAHDPRDCCEWGQAPPPMRPPLPPAGLCQLSGVERSDTWTAWAGMLGRAPKWTLQ